MKLTFHERFALLGILPTEEDYATLRITWTARLVLAPSAEEISEFGIVQEAAQIRWDVEKARDYLPDIPLDDAMITLLRRKLTDLDKAKKLNQNTYSLFEKIVLAYQQM
jgi:hypothetical protein